MVREPFGKERRCAALKAACFDCWGAEDASTLETSGFGEHMVERPPEAKTACCMAATAALGGTAEP